MDGLLSAELFRQSSRRAITSLLFLGRSSMRTSFVLAGATGAALVLSSSVLAANFDFSAVDTTGFTYVSTPVINDSGQVAFIGQRTGDATRGYFIGTSTGGVPV